MRRAPTPAQTKVEERKKTWAKPLFKELRLGFELSMYFWSR